MRDRGGLVPALRPGGRLQWRCDRDRIRGPASRAGEPPRALWHICPRTIAPDGSAGRAREGAGAARSHAPRLGPGRSLLSADMGIALSAGRDAGVFALLV